jgi:hypothetical protein
MKRRGHLTRGNGKTSSSEVQRERCWQDQKITYKDWLLQLEHQDTVVSPASLRSLIETSQDALIAAVQDEDWRSASGAFSWLEQVGARDIATISWEFLRPLVETSQDILVAKVKENRWYKASIVLEWLEKLEHRDATATSPAFLRRLIKPSQGAMVDKSNLQSRFTHASCTCRHNTVHG